MESLQKIWDDLNARGMGSDKASDHSYLEVYTEILAPYRETAKNVLEIGLFWGYSLLMWEQYFENAKVYGIDCDIKPHGGLADLTEMIAEGTHNIIIMDACDPTQVERRFKGMEFDVVIEDAGHNIEQQVELYNLYKNYLAPSAAYIIEDIQDIDSTRHIFENLDNSKEITILDRRKILNRYDDVIVIIKDK